VAGIGLTYTTLCLTVAAVLTLGSGDATSGDTDKPPPGAVATPATLAQTVSNAVHAPPEERAARQSDIEREFKVYFSRDNEIRIYRTGTYAEQLFDRALNCLFLIVALVFSGGELLACFLFGAVLVRSGFFSDPDVYRRCRPWLLGGGLLIGVPVQLAALILTFGSDRDALAGGPQLFGGIAIAIVYLTLLTGWAQTRRAEWLQNRLKAVGRLALTNYLAQTVICTTIFYSHGLALFATLDRPATLLIVLGVWTVQLLVSPVYLRFASIGPVEWVWRSLAQGRVLPLRRSRTDTVESHPLQAATEDARSPTDRVGGPESAHAQH
jgi:uncharacterized membrane protein YeiB